MSLPTTPARSIARSTLSTPSTAQHGTSPLELTPRSKVKAMLAAIDDDSDSEPSLKVGDKPQRVLSSVAGNIQKIDVRKDIQQGSAPDVEEDEEEDGEEEEESIFLPRGKLAARVNGQMLVRQESSSVNDGSADENAYTRMKKQLLAETTNMRGEPASKSGKDASDHKEATGRLSTPSGFNTPDALVARAHSSPNNSAIRQTFSPGLFLTPEGEPKVQQLSEKAAHADSSNSDLLSDPQSNKRFLELVAKAQAKVNAKQAAEEQKQKENIAKQRSFENELSRDAISDSGMSEGDGAAGRRLTQQSRPTRKASKKALEEMNRETQRMSRNMQLAHQAKTRKKITKDSLFARFNFRTSATATAGTPQNLSSSTAVSSAPASDLEEAPKQTPPTSPLAPEDAFNPSLDSLKQNDPTSIAAVSNSAEQEDDELPSMLDIMAQAATKLDKGKGKAFDHKDVDTASDSRKSRKTVFTQPPIRVHPAKPSSRSRNTNPDTDSDLEVLPIKQSRKSKGDVFDRLPAGKIQEGRSLQTLRALAHLTSPGKQMNGKKGNMSSADMQTSLQRRARQQAIEERAAKIEDLKGRGIIVQTAEERQKDQAEVEDLLEKARREGEEIMQKEKRAAKREKIANGEVLDLPDTSDEDQDYQEEDEADIEISGSEDEEVDGSEDGGNLAPDAEDSINEDDEDGEIHSDVDESANIGLIDNEASEDGDDEQEDDRDVEGSKEEHEHHGPLIQRSRRNKMVIDDDEDDEDEDVKPQAASQNSSPAVEIPTFFADPSIFNAVPMGMTQAFAATMADTQTQGDEENDEQDSMALLDTMPEPDFPMFDTNDSLQVVEDSQLGLQQHNTNTSSRDIDLHFSQSQVRYDVSEDTQGQPTATQISEIPDPTQDVGFVLSSPPPERFISVPPSTVDTVVLSGSAANGSPIQRKRRRLQRRAVEEDASDSGDDPVTTGHASAEIDTAANVFDAMKKASRAAKIAAAKAAFDKKKSEAKSMVEEQAQESEDEYAGLGGASDEESGGEEDEEVKAMMDHGEVNVDERKLAQFYANKERASDEKAIEKLYKDINSGLLRRKRGADFELSDSDDDAENRRKRKRREEAKMRAALLADENVGKIAEDPKKLAFLQTIEDRDPDDDLDFLDRPAEDSFRVEPDTQDDLDSQSQQPNLPATSLNKRKRPLQDSIPDSGNMRPPPAARRTAAPKRPATLAEIRESVSFLIEEPGAINIAPDPSSSASEDEENHGQEPHRNPRRTPANPIIDRLSLKRAESASISSGSRLAFHDPATNLSIGGFKVPSLLRRATTSQLNGNGADANGISTAATTERAAGGGEKGDFVRRGGTKRSSVNFISREKERRGAVEGVEKRRREEREREASRRRSGLGVLGVGSFE